MANKQNLRPSKDVIIARYEKLTGNKAELID